MYKVLYLPDAEWCYGFDNTPEAVFKNKEEAEKLIAHIIKVCCSPKVTRTMYEIVEID